jgi:hypothetical protein
VPDDAKAVEGVEGFVAYLGEEVIPREFQGQTEGVEFGAIETRRLGHARERVGLKLPGGLELFLGG